MSVKNFSKQREEIKQVVQESKLHPTAEEVYEELRGRKSKVSLSTVYRNLHLLAGEGVLQKLYMPNGSLRFDRLLTPHQHAVCTVCNRVFDVNYDSKGLKEATEDQTGFTVSFIQMSIVGICSGCQACNMEIS